MDHQIKLLFRTAFVKSDDINPLGVVLTFKCHGATPGSWVYPITVVYMGGKVVNEQVCPTLLMYRCGETQIELVKELVYDSKSNVFELANAAFECFDFFHKKEMFVKAQIVGSKDYNYFVNFENGTDNLPRPKWVPLIV